VERDWLARLSTRPIRLGEPEFAALIEETDWFPGDLQLALGNLIRSGKARNLDAKSTRRSKFLHYENAGERLQLEQEEK
jgi:hypothetical protein